MFVEIISLLVCILYIYGLPLLCFEQQSDLILFRELLLGRTIKLDFVWFEFIVFCMIL